MAKQLSTKKVIAIKLIIIVSLALILGISCFFSKPIEKMLGIGKKESSYVSGQEISDNDLLIHYIDVGQGDSTFIKFPDGVTMLIDAGTSKSADHIVEYVKDQGVSTLDYFILTHSDADHSGGAKAVLDAFEIKNIYRPFQLAVNKDTKQPIDEEELGAYKEVYSDLSLVTSATYQRFIVSAYAETYTSQNEQVLANISVHYDGIKIEQNGYSFEFFAPLVRPNADSIKDTLGSTARTEGYPTKYYKAGNSETSENASSPVMLLEYKEKKFMFTGDATEAVEKDVIASLTTEEKEEFKHIDVFQAGHHGSKTSNCQEFLDLMLPNYVVVSSGKGNSYGHPTEEFLDRVNSLSHQAKDYLLRTDTIGDIMFGFASGTLVYTANKEGDGVTIYWWYIALGLFIVLTIVVISVKITSNKSATAKRAIRKTKEVAGKMKK